MQNSIKIALDDGFKSLLLYVNGFLHKVTHIGDFSEAAKASLSNKGYNTIATDKTSGAQIYVQRTGRKLPLLAEQREELNRAEAQLVCLSDGKYYPVKALTADIKSARLMLDQDQNLVATCSDNQGRVLIVDKQELIRLRKRSQTPNAKYA